MYNGSESLLIWMDSLENEFPESSDIKDVTTISEHLAVTQNIKEKIKAKSPKYQEIFEIGMYTSYNFFFAAKRFLYYSRGQKILNSI